MNAVFFADQISSNSRQNQHNFQTKSSTNCRPTQAQIPDQISTNSKPIQAQIVDENEDVKTKRGRRKRRGGEQGSRAA